MKVQCLKNLPKIIKNGSETEGKSNKKADRFLSHFFTDFCSMLGPFWAPFGRQNRQKRGGPRKPPRLFGGDCAPKAPRGTPRPPKWIPTAPQDPQNDTQMAPQALQRQLKTPKMHPKSHPKTTKMTPRLLKSTSESHNPQRFLKLIPSILS